MVNHLLVTLVDSVLGKGKPTSGANYSYHCPFCNHRKTKLEVNFKENEEGVNHWHCWVCNSRGKSKASLFRKAAAPSTKLEELKKYVKIAFHTDSNSSIETIELPKEYRSLNNPDTNDISTRQALRYLRSRNIGPLEVKRYEIGFCASGKYRDMIILPSYTEDGMLNYFVGRNFGPSDYKYKNPKVSKDILPLGLHVNWKSPLIICEGMFDAIAIKRNAIPLLGKTIPKKLMHKIVESSVKQIFIALDNDALKQAFEYCETFLNHGKEVFLIELGGKDPSELGFEEFTKLLHKSKPLTFRTLIEKKFQL